MSHFVIPRMFDEALELEDDEDAYIIKEVEKPTKIIFSRGTIKNKNIVFVSTVQNWNEKNKTAAVFKYDYAIVKAPRNIVPNQRKCLVSMFVEDKEGEFLIILR